MHGDTKYRAITMAYVAHCSDVAILQYSILTCYQLRVVVLAIHSAQNNDRN